MSVAWRRYVEDNGGKEYVAQKLTALLGREILPVRVRDACSPTKQPPKSWLKALNLEFLDDQPQSPVEDPLGAQTAGDDGMQADDAGGRRAEQKPKPPSDSEFVLPKRGPLDIAGQAKERIAGLHVFAGAAIATAADPAGFEADKGVGGGIAKLWTDRSDPIAEAWIAWAEEGNRFAQSFVRMMAIGGSGSSLLLGYAALLGGTAYIMGAMPDNEATRVLYGRYARYRTVVPEPSAEGDVGADRGRNGAAPAGAGDTVGDARAPAGL